jgi:hypothetical protein
MSFYWPESVISFIVLIIVLLLLRWLGVFEK